MVDDERDLGPDDITTAQLTAFFDWLAGNGWSVVSLDDLEAARSGTQAAAAQADPADLRRRLCQRLYAASIRLLRAYRFPAVFFLVGSWMETAPGGMVRYGDKDVRAAVS